MTVEIDDSVSSMNDSPVMTWSVEGTIVRRVAVRAASSVPSVAVAATKSNWPTLLRTFCAVASSRMSSRGPAASAWSSVFAPPIPTMVKVFSPAGSCATIESPTLKPKSFAVRTSITASDSVRGARPPGGERAAAEARVGHPVQRQRRRAERVLDPLAVLVEQRGEPLHEALRGGDAAGRSHEVDRRRVDRRPDRLAEAALGRVRGSDHGVERPVGAADQPVEGRIDQRGDDEGARDERDRQHDRGRAVGEQGGACAPRST
jgi:hypothetical protein